MPQTQVVIQTNDISPIEKSANPTIMLSFVGLLPVDDLQQISAAIADATEQITADEGATPRTFAQPSGAFPLPE